MAGVLTRPHATQIQQQYAMRNRHGFTHVGEFCWGMTASDGPGDTTKTISGVERQFFDYLARGAPFGPDDGMLAPWAVAAHGASMSQLQVHAPNPYGFKASFNPVFHGDVEHRHRLVSPYHFGINEGPTVLMIENQRSEMIWNLIKKYVFLRRGLVAAGFTGGWLQA